MESPQAVVERVTGHLYTPQVQLANAAEALRLLGLLSYARLGMPEPDAAMLVEGILARHAQVDESARQIQVLRTGFARIGEFELQEQRMQSFPTISVAGGAEPNIGEGGVRADGSYRLAVQRYVQDLLPHVSPDTMFGATRTIDWCLDELHGLGRKGYFSTVSLAADDELPRIRNQVYGPRGPQSLQFLVNRVLDVTKVNDPSCRWPEIYDYGPPQEFKPTSRSKPGRKMPLGARVRSVSAGGVAGSRNPRSR